MKLTDFETDRQTLHEEGDRLDRWLATLSAHGTGIALPPLYLMAVHAYAANIKQFTRNYCDDLH